MKMFEVYIEYTDGTTKEMIMDRAVWFDIVYQRIEKDDNVSTYRVQNLEMIEQ